jgi:hypothetical protein
MDFCGGNRARFSSESNVVVLHVSVKTPEKWRNSSGMFQIAETRIFLTLCLRQNNVGFNSEDFLPRETNAPVKVLLFFHAGIEGAANYFLADLGTGDSAA